MNHCLGKKRGRHPLLGTKLDEQLQAKIISMRSQQAVINSNIVLSIARALLLKDNKMLLTEYGGPIILEKECLEKDGFQQKEE